MLADVDDSAELVLRRLCSARVEAGFHISGGRGGYDIGWDHRRRRMWVEGHPAGDCLATAASLPAELERLRLLLADLGLSRLNLSLRRLDVTADVAFDDPIKGMAVISAVGRASFPRLKAMTAGYPVESAYFAAPRGSVKCRVYDRGYRLDRDRGRLLRFEVQDRFDARDCPAVQDLDSAFLRFRFNRRFRPLGSAPVEIPASLGADPLVLELAALQQAGALSAVDVERLIGFVTMAAHGVERAEPRTRDRRRAQLAALGLPLRPSPRQPATVHLPRLLQRISTSPTWDAVEGVA